MKTIEQLKKYVTNRLADNTSTMKEFVEHLTRNPYQALMFSREAVLAAASDKALLRIPLGDDDIPEIALAYARGAIHRYVEEGFSGSTSALDDSLKAGELKALARFISFAESVYFERIKFCDEEDDEDEDDEVID